MAPTRGVPNRKELRMQTRRGTRGDPSGNTSKDAVEQVAEQGTEQHSQQTTEQLPINQQTEVPSSQATDEARKRLEQELTDIPEVSDKDLREMEQLREQMMAKRQKVERMNQLKRQIAEASEALKQFQQEEGILDTIDLSFELGNRQSFRQIPRQELFIDPVSPLSNHLQASPWPVGYRPTSLPAFDGQCSPKQFLLSYKATV